RAPCGAHRRQRGERNAQALRPGRGAPQAGTAPGQDRPARGPPQGASRVGTTPAAAPAAGRVNDEPHALQHGPAAPRADVAEPGYAPASEAGGREAMRVRPPPSAPPPGAPAAPVCLRSSVEEQRASTPRAEVRLLSGALTAADVEQQEAVGRVARNNHEFRAQT